MLHGAAGTLLCGSLDLLEPREQLGVGEQRAGHPRLPPHSTWVGEQVLCLTQ